MKGNTGLSLVSGLCSYPQCWKVIIVNSLKKMVGSAAQFRVDKHIQTMATYSSLYKLLPMYWVATYIAFVK